MVPLRVVAPHQSRSSQPALISFPPCSHASLFFQRITYLPPQRALLNPLFINHFRTLFIVTGGVLPPSCLPSSEVQTCGRFNVFPSYFLCFQILAHSLALFCTHARLNPFIFKRFRTLCKKPPGGEGSMGWSPKNEMTWTENAPKPLSSLTTVNCPLSTTRHVTAQETSFVLPVSREKI